MASGRPDYTSQALIKGSDSGTHRTVAVDPAGNMLTLMKGQYGGAPVTIAVDATGKLYGLLQGDYGGAVKTLAVDSQGRMLAVLTDPEDVFGNPHYLGAGELAARLGSPSVMTRTGQVIFMDPGGINDGQYTVTGSGASYAMSLGADLGPLRPLYNKMVCGPAEDDYITVSKGVPLVAVGKAGIEFVATFPTALKKLELTLAAYTGAMCYVAGWKIDLTTQKLYYWTTASGWVEIGASPYLGHNTRPVLVKATLNSATGKYGSLNVGGSISDLSAGSPASSADTTTRALSFSWKYYCNTTGDATIRMNDVVVTCNEV